MAHVFLSIKYHGDNANRDLIERLSAALASGGHIVFCVARDLEEWGRVRFSSRELMRRTFAAIEASELVLVELSEKGVGVGIEAGYAHARGIPLAAAAQQGCDISETLLGIAQVARTYTREDEVLRIVDDALSAGRGL